MNEMVERVAKAIDSHLASLEPTKSYIENQDLPDIARAAIEAMREPTEEMLNAGERFELPENSWPAMIDAALAETLTPPRGPTIIP